MNKQLTDYDTLHPWLVMGLQEGGNFACLAKYRFRNDAEGHAQKLNKLLPGYFLVAFEEPKRISDRY